MRWNATGFVNNGNAADVAAWDLETDLDVQAAHAICLNLQDPPGRGLHRNWGRIWLPRSTLPHGSGRPKISNSYGWLNNANAMESQSKRVQPCGCIYDDNDDHGYGAYYPSDLNSVIAVGGHLPRDE